MFQLYCVAQSVIGQIQVASSISGTSLHMLLNEGSSGTKMNIICSIIEQAVAQTLQVTFNLSYVVLFYQAA